MEQTRAIEGKPTPRDLRVEPLRPIVEAGARFQSGRLPGRRLVMPCGEDREVRADRMKVVTVFMNLIGNALKYSGGDVKVAWRTAGETVRAAVQDRGTAGRGVSEAQARRLFVPFGRLEAHADVAGTGLGLVSARKVVEAHGGEIFVEGYADGTPASLPFSTAATRPCWTPAASPPLSSLGPGFPGRSLWPVEASSGRTAASSARWAGRRPPR